MIYSKKQISKAGKVLLTSKSQEDINIALDIINTWRTSHLHPLRVMKNALLRILLNSSINPILVSQRLKRLSSIEYKLDLNENMGLGGMQDIGGYRVVLKDLKDLIKLQKTLEKPNRRHKLERVVDYVQTPKKSGYRSIHFIYRYSSKVEKHDGLKLELQVRTKLQHNWATAVETAGIFTKTSLKSSQGPDDWLEFFQVVSSLFAIKEELPKLEIHADKSMEELMVYCYNLCNKLNILTTLKALRVSTNKIETDNFPGEYYILNINIKEMKVQILIYDKKEYERATREYLRLEKSITEGENAVVLVSASSIKSLKKAYPSYFLDTSEFIQALEKINRNCETLKLVK